ncbi:hypothetical protein MMPV_007155 [Pyropia vietnamensis]
MVAAASMVHALHAASVYLAPATLLSPMRADLGLSVSQIALPLNVYRLINAVLLVPAGAVLDRSRPDAILRTSVIAAAVLGMALPFCNNLPQLVALQAAFAVTKLFGGLTAMLLLVSRAFGDRPGMGTATSCLLAGYSFAGFLAPSLVGSLCAAWGWRAASAAMSTLFFVVGVPLTLVFLRAIPPLPIGEDEVVGAPAAASGTPKSSTEGKRQPQAGRLASNGDVARRGGGTAKAADSTDSLVAAGASPDRASLASSRASSDRLARPDATNAPPPATGSVVAPRAAPTDGTPPPVECDVATDVSPRLLTLPYLALLTVVASFSFSMHVILDHLLVFLREDFGGSGLHLDVAARYLSALNLGALVTKLAVGPLADRYDKGLLMAGFGVIGVVASALLFDWVGGALLLTSSPVQVGAFVGLYAVAYAGVFSLSTASLQDFGPARLGLRCNLNLVALFAAGSVGSYVAGTLRTHFGSYVWSFVASGASWAGVIGAALAYTATIRAMRGGNGGGGGGGGYRKLSTDAGGGTGRSH